MSQANDILTSLMVIAIIAVIVNSKESSKLISGIGEMISGLASIIQIPTTGVAK
jgi:hypothetical protein